MIETIKKSGFFNCFSADELENLRRRLKMEEYSAGKKIFCEGSRGSCMYVIASGNVEISKKGRVLARLGEGDMFGEMGLFGKEIRSASAVSSGESRLIRVEHIDIEKFILAHPDSGCRFLFSAMGEISERLRRTSSYLVAVYETGKIIAGDLEAEEMSLKILRRLIDEIKGATGGLLLVHNPFTGMYDLQSCEKCRIMDEEKAVLISEEAGKEEFFKIIDDSSVFITPSMEGGNIKGYILIEKRGSTEPLSINEEIITSAVAGQLALGLVRSQTKSEEDARKLFQRKKEMKE